MEMETRSLHSLTNNLTTYYANNKLNESVHEYKKRNSIGSNFTPKKKKRK
jgi:hypothetical protein